MDQEKNEESIEKKSKEVKLTKFNENHEKRKKHRPYSLERRLFQSQWTEQFFFIEFNGKPTCIVCGDVVAVAKKFNVERHYRSKHTFIFDCLQGEERKIRVQELINAFYFQQQLALDVCHVPKIIPKLKKGAKPVLLPELPVKSQRRKRSRTSKVEVSVTPQVVQDDDTHSIALSQNSNSKSKCKSLSDDPLIIKYENVPEMEMSEPYETTDIKYIDPQTFINDIMITEELQVLRQRVSELEYQNIQLKHKNSELSNSLNYAETEKKQLRAELDTAVLANRKLVIVKTSLVNTIQNLGKSIGAVTQTILPIDPTLDLSDTIVGI